MNKQLRAEMIRAIYKYRSEFYKQQKKLKQSRRNANHYKRLKHSEMVEAHEEELKKRDEIVTFLSSEIDILRRIAC